MDRDTIQSAAISIENGEKNVSVIGVVISIESRGQRAVIKDSTGIADIVMTQGVNIDKGDCVRVTGTGSLFSSVSKKELYFSSAEAKKHNSKIQIEKLN